MGTEIERYLKEVAVMLYYHCIGELVNDSWRFENDDSEKKAVQKICKVTTGQTDKKEDVFFVTEIENMSVEVGAVVRTREGIDMKLKGFLESIGIEAVNFRFNEVTSDKMEELLGRGKWHNYLSSNWERFMESRYMLSSFESDDEIIAEESEWRQIEQTADSLCVRNTLKPELERIRQGSKNKKVSGHPVHYMVQTDDPETADLTVETLVQALYLSGRISGMRIMSAKTGPQKHYHYPQKSLTDYYSVAEGITVRIDFSDCGEKEDDMASPGRSHVKSACDLLRSYRNTVLTILVLPKECTKIKEWLWDYLGEISIVELKEEFVSGAEAKVILSRKAKKSHLRPDKQLLGAIDESKTYDLRNLYRDYDSWYNAKLKKTVYPQYQVIRTITKKEIEEKPKGDAYGDLERMIGLSEAKKVIGRALDYYKVRKMFADKGVKQTTPSMHMVFTGNPGTAKTTVARLFAEIMRDNRILSRGHLVEVGRSDLVGQYVGWTANIVKSKFREAMGGVLFIDEAYSLVDDRSGLFGDEAINTIVQEMENHRDELIVIFAGYPKEMEAFLNKNPGLRSRIAFHVPFADYNCDELCEIAGIMAEKNGMHLTQDAVERLKENFSAVMDRPDFGNGRYVRNVLERARMAQASRLLTMDPDILSREDMETLCGADIELPEEKKQVIRLGFCG